MWFGLVAALALLLSGACTAKEDGQTLSPAAMTPRAVATEFAKAVVSDDFSSARALVCQGTPDPEGDGEFPFQDASVVGLPDPEPPPEDVLVIIVSKPAPDLFVPFEASEDGEEVNGYVDVTFGGDNCVMTYGISRALE